MAALLLSALFLVLNSNIFAYPFNTNERNLFGGLELYGSRPSLVSSYGDPRLPDVMRQRMQKRFQEIPYSNIVATPEEWLERKWNREFMKRHSLASHGQGGFPMLMRMRMLNYRALPFNKYPSFQSL